MAPPSTPHLQVCQSLTGFCPQPEVRLAERASLFLAWASGSRCWRRLEKMSEVAEDRGQRPRDGEGLAQGHPHLEPELRAPNPPPPLSVPSNSPLRSPMKLPFQACPVLSRQSWLWGSRGRGRGAVHGTGDTALNPLPPACPLPIAVHTLRCGLPIPKEGGMVPTS